MARRKLLPRTFCYVELIGINYPVNSSDGCRGQRVGGLFGRTNSVEVSFVRYSRFILWLRNESLVGGTFMFNTTGNL